jgi:hypothetical protein
MPRYYFHIRHDTYLPDEEGEELSDPEQTRAPLEVDDRGASVLPSAGYYLKHAQITARLALAESNPDKAKALHFLVLDYCDKADKAKAGEARREDDVSAA